MSTQAPRLPPRNTAGLVVATLVVALNLRPAIVAVGPLADAIHADTGLGALAMSMLTTLPLLCLGGFAAVAPVLSSKIGIERGVFVAVVAITAGIALRTVPTATALFVGMALAGSGIAVANVLIPALIKRDQPHRLGLAMAGYSVALQTGATVASGMTAPIGSALHLSWRCTLALWGILAAIALVTWVPHTRHGRDTTARHSVRYPVWRSRLGWSGAALMGIPSGIYFALIAWLPTVWHSRGAAPAESAQLMLVLGASGIVGGLPMPILAARAPSQRPLVAVLTGLFAIGLTGLMWGPSAAWSPVLAVALGLAQGASLSLALTVFALRCHTAAGAAQLSGMAQSAGYLIAAAAPLLVGVVHDVAGGWTAPLAALAALLVPFTVIGLSVAKPRYLEEEVEHT